MDVLLKAVFAVALCGGGQGNGIFSCGKELSQIPLAFYLAVR